MKISLNFSTCAPYIQKFFNKKESNDYINLLPKELLIHIFFLSGEFEVKKVSKKWNNIVVNSKTLENYLISKKIEKQFSRFLVKKLKVLYTNRCLFLVPPYTKGQLKNEYYGNIISYLFTVGYKITRNDVEFVISTFPTLQKDFKTFNVHAIYFKKMDQLGKYKLYDQGYHFVAIDYLALCAGESSIPESVQSGMQRAIEKLNRIIEGNREKQITFFPVITLEVIKKYILT